MASKSKSKSKSKDFDDEEAALPKSPKPPKDQVGHRSFLFGSTPRRFDTRAAPRTWEETGIIIRDFEEGVRLDHIVKDSLACKHPELRIGLAMVRVGRYDTSNMHFDEVTRYIAEREAEQKDLILKFVRTGTAGMDGDHSDFVINPSASTYSPNSLIAETFDVEDKGDEESDPVDNTNPLYVNESWDKFLLFVKRIHFAYEGLMLATVIFTRNFGNVGCIVALVACINVAAGGILSNKHKNMLLCYSIVILIAVPVGILGHIGMLWYIPYCLDRADGAAADGTEVKPCSLGPAEDYMTIIVYLSMVLDLVFRLGGLYVSVTSYKVVKTWLKEIEDERKAAACKVQAVARGITTRRKIREQRGVVTRALAGKHHKAAFYTPETPLEIKAQQFMRMWRKSRKPQTFHQIRQQASQTHACVLAMRNNFEIFDDDKSGTIDLREAGKMFDALGAAVSPVSIEFLFAEAFAPPTKKESAAKVQQMKQKATVEPDTNEEERQAEKAAKQLVRENAEKEGVEAPIDTDEWPEIGDIVRLTSEAISKNKNNILQKNCLKVKKGEDTGVVVDIDETSRRYSIEVEANGLRSWYQNEHLILDAAHNFVDPAASEDLAMTDEEIKTARDSYRRQHGDLSKLMREGLDFDQFVSMVGLGFLLKIIPKGGGFAKFHAAFLSAIDLWIHLDVDGDGVLIISEVELRLEKLKIQDIVTMEKLKKLDPFNSDYVPFTQYMSPALHWLDASLDEV